MPHIIVEYSDNIEEQVDIPALLGDVHGALAAEGIEAGRIKTRGIALKNSVVGENTANIGQMVHITLKLLEGRDIATKQQYGQAVHKAAKAAVIEVFPSCKVTLDVRDMTAEAYILG